MQIRRSSSRFRYLDSFDMNGFTCPPSGVFACNNLIVGSLKATF